MQVTKISLSKPFFSEFTTIVRTSLKSSCDVATLKRGDISFPLFHERASSAREDLLYGSGAVCFHCSEGKDLTEQEIRLLYAAFALEFGNLMELYGRLYDVKSRVAADKATEYVTISNTNGPAPFHTDGSWLSFPPDLIGLLCINKAREGGENLLVGAEDLYSSLKEHSPESLKILCTPFPRESASPGHTASLEEVRNAAFPIFEKQGEKIRFQYMRRWIEEGRNKIGSPLLEEEKKAFDALDNELQTNPTIVELGLERYDMLFLNNHTVAHTRKEFIDDAQDPSEKRLMVRAWMSCVNP